MSSSLGSKRVREEATSASTGAAPPLQQSLTDKDNGKVVTNSPYGASRAALGWGTPFQPMLKAVLAELPNVRIGISSLNGVPGKDREMPTLMQQYQKKFSVLEHCYPYHRMCDVEQWDKWKAMPATKDFWFTVKANQFLTHLKLLEMDADLTTHVDNFFVQRCPRLGDRLAAVLVQLPPTFANTTNHFERLRVLSAHIPSSVPIAVEFRHPSWFCDEVYDFLRAAKWTLVATHHHDTGNTPLVDTGSGVMYVRLHGAVDTYAGDYGKTVMEWWGGRILDFVSRNPSGRVLFFLNNNESHIGNLTSSIVDATQLAQCLRAAVKSAAASGGESDAPASNVPTPSQPGTRPPPSTNAAAAAVTTSSSPPTPAGASTPVKATGSSKAEAESVDDEE